MPGYGRVRLRGASRARSREPAVAKADMRWLQASETGPFPELGKADTRSGKGPVSLARNGHAALRAYEVSSRGTLITGCEHGNERHHLPSVLAGDRANKKGADGAFNRYGSVTWPSSASVFRLTLPPLPALPRLPQLNNLPRWPGGAGGVRPRPPGKFRRVHVTGVAGGVHPRATSVKPLDGLRLRLMLQCDKRRLVNR